MSTLALVMFQPYKVYKLLICTHGQRHKQCMARFVSAKPDIHVQYRARAGDENQGRQLT